MQDLLSQIGVGGFIAIVAVVGGLLIPLSAIVGAFTYKHRRLSIEAALKHDMLELGMSAEEIERVLGASTKGRHRKHCGPRFMEESVHPKIC